MLSSRRESTKVGTTASSVPLAEQQTKRTKQVENAVVVAGKQSGKTAQQQPTTKTFG